MGILTMKRQQVTRAWRRPETTRSRIARAAALLAGLTMAATAFTGCAAEDLSVDASNDFDQIAETYGLDGPDARTVIETLEAMPLDARPTGLIASVQPDALVLSDQSTGAEAALPLPEGEFYLSLAPYLGQTHECFSHSLTTCVGELRGEDVSVLITDRVDGTVLFDGLVTTNDNGFVGVWLPREKDATITVDYADQTATALVSTDGDSPTCLTTLRLS